MKVCITVLGSEQPRQDGFYYTFCDFAKKNPGPHTIVEHPSEADLILLLCSKAESLTPEQQKMLTERPNDFFVFETYDLPTYAFQGTYVSISNSLTRNRRYRSYCQPMINRYVEEIYASGQKIEPDLLFSFMGGSTSWLRKKMYQHDYGRKDVLIQDTSYHHEWSYRTEEWEKNKIHYAQVLARTKFVVSPRGATATSSRIYEGMQMARPLVIMADDFYPPNGPDWEKFMIRVRERDMPRLPEILTPYLDRWEEMGKIARSEWEKWFAPEMWFQRVVGYSQDIAKERVVSEAVHIWKIPYLQMIQNAKINSYFALRNTAIRVLNATGLAKKLHLNRA